MSEKLNTENNLDNPNNEKDRDGDGDVLNNNQLSIDEKVI